MGGLTVKWTLLTPSLRFSYNSIPYGESKNHRRSSGGMLQHKFNLIEFWYWTFYILHFTFDIQPMDQWTKEVADIVIEETLVTL